jgi:hypothetical protein
MANFRLICFDAGLAACTQVQAAAKIYEKTMTEMRLTTVANERIFFAFILPLLVVLNVFYPSFFHQDYKQKKEDTWAFVELCQSPDMMSRKKLPQTAFLR